MNVGNSIRKAVDDWELGEFEAAMLHACNALDGTARKVFPALGNKVRFTTLIRDNYEVFGPMGAPGINLEETVFPVEVLKPTNPSGKPDIADVIYSIHRCTHGHGDELPDGFDLIADAAGPARFTRMSIERGKLRLSDRSVFGLLGIAVLSVANTDQKVPDGYHLTFAGTEMPINDWWGRKDDFLVLAAQETVPRVKLDFGDWMLD